MRNYNLLDLIDSSSSYDFTYTDGGETVTVWTGTEFFTISRAKFYHMTFDAVTVTDAMDEATALAAAKAEFLAILSTWKSLHGYDFKRVIDALNTAYNPLENYDRMEEGEEHDAHHKGTKTSTNEETVHTPRVKVKTTGYKVPFDSSSEVKVDASESVPVEGTDTIARTAANNYVTVQDIDGMTFDNDVHSFVNRRTHGNIGVTSNVDLLNQEKELRAESFRENCISLFVREFCYCVKGV